MSKNTENAEAKTTCDMTRKHIASLIKTLQAELKSSDMKANDWGTAGSLGHIREILTEAVGHVTGIEASEILTALANENN